MLWGRGCFGEGVVKRASSQGLEDRVSAVRPHVVLFGSWGKAEFAGKGLTSPCPAPVAERASRIL